MKQYILFLLLAGVISCNQHNTEKATVSGIQERNIALVHRFFKHFNNHDWKNMAEMYTNPADFKDPTLGEGIVKQSHEQTIAKYTVLNEQFPDIHDELIEVYPSGDKNIIAEFISSGTLPNGSKFKLPICMILTIENGKITKDYTYFDN